jgi:PAS domain S-box-containing protein
VTPPPTSAVPATAPAGGEVNSAFFASLANLSPEETQVCIDLFAHPSFVVDVYPDGTCRYVALSQAASDMIGRPVSVYRGATPESLFSPELAARRTGQYQIAAEASGPTIYQDWAETLMPGRRLWRQTFTPLATPGSSSRVRLFCSITDITGQLQAKRQLIESKAALRRALRIGKLGHWHADLKAGTLEWSEEMFAIHGVDTTTTKPSVAAVEAYLSPADRARFRAARRQAVLTKSGYALEMDMERPDGSPLSIRFEAEPELDDAGELVGFFGVTQDITETRAAKQESLLRGRYLQRALSVGRMGYWHVDLRDNALYWSPEVFRIHGLEPAEFAPDMQRVLQFYRQEDRQRVVDARAQGVAAKTNYSFKADITTADGRPLSIFVEGEPEFDAGGELIGYFGITQDITNAQQTERLLQRAQDVAKIGYWRWFVKTNKIEWSDSIYRLHGLTKNLFTPTAAAEVGGVPPFEMARIRALTIEAIKTKRPLVYETSVRVPQGEETNLRIVGEPEVDASGNVVSFFGITQDITDQQRVSAALQESEALLRRASTVGRIGHWRHNWTTGKITWSREVYNLLGLEPALFELTPASSLRMYPREQRAEVLSLYEHAIKTGEPFGFDTRVARQDHAQLWVRIEGEVDRDAVTGETQLFGVVQDITDRRVAELALREKARELERSQSVGRIGHWRVDFRDNSATWSNEMYVIHGVSQLDYRPNAGEMIGQAFRRVERERLLALRDEAIAQRKELKFEAECFRPDGSTLWVAVDAQPELDGNGVVIGFFGITQDISERKSSELALAQSQERLERAQDIAQIGYWRIDYATQCAEWSSQMFRLFEADPDRFQPNFDTTLALFAEAEKERVRQWAAAARASTRPVRFEADAASLAGRQIRVEVEAEVERDHAAQPTAIFGILRDITEQHQAKLALQARAKELERSQSVGRIGHWRINYQQKSAAVSEQVCRIHGVEPKSFKPTQNLLLRVFQGRDRENVKRLLADAIRNRTGFSFDADTTRPDGVTVSVHVEAEPEFDSKGEVVGFFGITQDVTDRRAAERALRRRALELARSQQVGRIGHWRQDLNDGTVAWSSQLYRIFGADPEVFRPKPGSQIATFVAADQERIAELRAAALAEARGYSYEAEATTLDGRQIWVHVEAEPELGLEGKVTSLFGVTQDITERKLAELERIASETRYRAIVETLKDAQIGVFITRPGGYILDANDALLNMLVIPAREVIIGKQWFSLQAGANTQPDVVAARERGLQLLETTGTFGTEVQWTDTAGKVRTLLVRAARLGTNEYLHVVVDQTEERALRQAQEALQRSLQQVQKLDALGQLAAGLAHEINNLLQPMLTFARQAQREADSAKRSKQLDVVVESSRQMRDMVSRILGFSRPGTQAPQALVADALVQDAIALARPLIQRAVSLEVDLQAGDVKINVPQGEFNQVIVNLLINAGDAMAGSGDITVRTRRFEGEPGGTVPQLGANRYLRLTIADTGGGMAADVIPRIFDPFFSTKDGEGRSGTGLGLTMVYSIVARAGGGIRVESREAVGTRFSIFLPLI